LYISIITGILATYGSPSKETIVPITPSPAVERACDVLRHLARHPDETFTVSGLSKELAIPRATCDAILQSLAEAAFVIRADDDLRYRLGPSCIAIGDAARLANSALRAAAVEAEGLARNLEAFAAVSLRDGQESRVAEVFDFGPPFGPRAQVGQSIPHEPPFGAVYVAWEEHDAQAWIARAGRSLDHAARDRYRHALAEVRDRGYSVTIASPRRPELVDALSTLVSRPSAEHARHTRDEVIAELVHSEYLATDLDATDTLRVSHMSAPVFDRSGHAVSSILLLGPEFDVTPNEVRTRGDQLVRAAARATSSAGGRAPEFVAATTNRGQSS
jgi:DNA-binding IclR family transcriptional regulator